ncbi:MAG: class I SAM-dependent methyltransferase [Catalinimonas sp.]
MCPSSDVRPAALHALIGDIDPAWLEQLLRGRVRPGDRLLDAGCGMGRNLIYPLRAGVEVWGVDTSEDDIAYLRRQASAAWCLPADRFRTEALEALSFPDEHFDAVCCSLVMHFARDDAHFAAMLGELWRVLRPGGFLYVRTAVADHLPEGWRALGGNRYVAPGGRSAWYLPVAAMLSAWGESRRATAAYLSLTYAPGERGVATWTCSKPSPPTMR